MESMPAIFLGHGSPMNALSRNAYTQAWAAMGRSLARPTAVLAVSAHWYRTGCAVTANTAPRTIHDFGGFPQALYEIQYPAPGSPALARRVQSLLAPVEVALDERWGLDHGTWSVLMHLFPDADIPVVQLGIDKREAPRFHYELGKRLMPLRDEGVLVIGSGNLVHSLAAYNWEEPEVAPYAWAERFEQQVRAALLRDDSDAVIDYPHFGADARRSVPTPDHYLPLLYILGLRREDDVLSFPVDGMDGGSISMLAVRFG